MRKHVFADESGDTEFRVGHNISRYFILCTVQMEPEPIGQEIMALRRELIWKDLAQDECIHCTTDRQAVRDEVFALIAKHEMRIDATILEKRKAAPQTRVTETRFYQYAWFYHFRHVAPKLFARDDEAAIGVASMGTKAKKAAFKSGIHDVCAQSNPHLKWKVSYWHAHSDPCLLVADYCAWALRRKWESNDARSYGVIAKKIATEFDLWRRGTAYHY